MKLHLFDATPESATPAKHGVLGPAHAADVTVDYEYQAELWVNDIGQDYPEIVRVECPDMGRTWVRDSNSTMSEVKDHQETGT